MLLNSVFCISVHRLYLRCYWLFILLRNLCRVLYTNLYTPGVRNSHFDKMRLFDRWLCCSARCHIYMQIQNPISNRRNRNTFDVKKHQQSNEYGQCIVFIFCVLLNRYLKCYHILSPTRV